MANHGGVRVDLDGILRQLEANGFDDVRVEFAPDGDAGPALIDAARRGVGVANEAAAQRIWGTGPTASIAGASVKLASIAGPDALDAWLDAFVEELRTSGLAGVVRATPVVRLPGWISQIAEPMVTAYVAVGARGKGGWAGWSERAVRWAAEAGGDAYLSSAGMNQVDATGEVAAHLAAMLEASSSGALLYADSEGATRAAFVQIGANGQATYQSYESQGTLAARINRARAAILAEAEAAQFAFLAATPHQAYSWDARGKALPPLRPEVSGAALRVNAELWNRYVPDVHGIQLLTDEHMSRVADLSQWSVTEVTSGRYLVEAPDVAEWFRSGGPAQSTVDRARADFGAALAPVDDVR